MADRNTTNVTKTVGGDMTKTRTFWMSFADPEKPEGQQFLGVCILDVTTEDVVEGLPDMRRWFPRAEEGAEWNFAAMRKAHRLGCNPGGQIAYVDITGRHAPAPLIKNKLLSHKELWAAGLVEA